MTRAVWTDLLARTRDAWSASPALSAYCPFPDDVIAQKVTPRALPPARIFECETGWTGRTYGDLRDAVRAAGPCAFWRDTYAGTRIAQAFLDRFGCYALIGPEGGFTSERARAWFVYMPAGLYYPWHHHKADEAYLVLDGEAQFYRADKAAVTLSQGAVLIHHPMEPHAMETAAHPVLALVVWRGDFDHPPVLTYEDAR